MNRPPIIGPRPVQGRVPAELELDGALLPFVDGEPLTLRLAACPHRHVLIFRDADLLIEVVARLAARHVEAGRAPALSTDLKRVAGGQRFLAECRAQHTRVAMDARIVRHEPATDRFAFRYREILLDGEPVDATGCPCCAVPPSSTEAEPS